jgi:NAD(P)H-hydrate epimerase
MHKNNYEVEKGFEPITSQQMYKIEDNGEKIFGFRKMLMMENAGSRIADFLIESFGEDLAKKKIVSVCGLGNNGGDAIVAIRHLSGFLYSKSVTNQNRLVVVLLGEPNQIRTEESKTNWETIEKINSIMKVCFNEQNTNDIEKVIEGSDIIIDGLIGTGINGKIKEPYSKIIDKINKQKSKSFIFSVDIPSGLNPDTGEVHDKSVKADSTITFHRIKRGILKNIEHCGEIYPVKIGIPIEAEMDVLQQ